MGNHDHLIGVDHGEGHESVIDAKSVANLILKSSDTELEDIATVTDDFPCPSEAPIEESKGDYDCDGDIFDFGFLTRPGCFDDDDDEEDGEDDDGDGDNSLVSHDSDDSELAAHLEHEYDTASETSSAHIDKSDLSLAQQYRNDRLLYAALRSQSKGSSTEIKTHKKKKPTDKRTAAQQICCDNLKVRWMARSPEAPLSDDMILRFALAAPRGRFHENSAWKRMKRFDRRYLTLTAKGLERQLRTKVSWLNEEAEQSYGR